LEKGKPQQVKLSQVSKADSPKAKRRPGIDSAAYSEATQKMLKEGYAAFEKDETTGEAIQTVELNEIQVIAKSRTIPERAGKINIDFKVTVPASLINKKWQIQLTPRAEKNGKTIVFDKILISGAQFLRQQEKGYQLYQNFIASIIPDSAYMQQLFDEEGYQKALFSIEEKFYHEWQKGQLSQIRFVDWRSVRNKRNQLFNGVMERKRASIDSTNWRKSLPAYGLQREITHVPGEWNNFLAPDNQVEMRDITPADSAAISKKFFDYKRMMENERRKASIDKMYSEYIRFPKEPCKLDTIIHTGDKFEYYYSQNIDADENIKKIDVTVDGDVIAIDESRYRLPKSDTISYFISSMVQFVDNSTKYKTIVVSRQATANEKAYIQYNVGSNKYIESIGKNKSEIERVLSTLHSLTGTGELIVDSINIVASSSPEGDERTNMTLSLLRATGIKTYLDGIIIDKTVISACHPKALGEDWETLIKLISEDSNIKHSVEIQKVISSHKGNAREIAIRRFADYPYIRKELYPLLRAVNFEFHLHRREMVKDTIHTSVVDTTYMEAVEQLKNRRYKNALAVLSEYNDLNTTVALMSLGRDQQALDVLKALPADENTYYLEAILFARIGHPDEAIKAFEKSCMLDESKWWRGSLDPEINKLITDYNLNFEQ
jgi:tetratricopeptide (TPR) repeat protein